MQWTQNGGQKRFRIDQGHMSSLVNCVDFLSQNLVEQVEFAEKTHLAAPVFDVDAA